MSQISSGEWQGGGVGGLFWVCVCGWGGVGWGQGHAHARACPLPRPGRSWRGPARQTAVPPGRCGRTAVRAGWGGGGSGPAEGWDGGWGWDGVGWNWGGQCGDRGPGRVEALARRQRMGVGTRRGAGFPQLWARAPMLGAQFGERAAEDGNWDPKWKLTGRCGPNFQPSPIRSLKWPANGPIRNTIRIRIR